MTPDAILLDDGMKALIEKLGLVNAERFVALTNRNRFDYTEWRQGLFEGRSLEELSREAMEYSETLEPLRNISK
jgi:hypothetical protein